MSNQGNYFPQQGSVPNGPGPGNINGPGPGAYPQQTPYNPYYPTQPGNYYPQPPTPGVYGPTPYGAPARNPAFTQINFQPAVNPVPVPARPNVQVNIQPATPAPTTVVHQEKVTLRDIFNSIKPM